MPDEFATAYCPRCDAMTKHRIVMVLETHPVNKGRTCKARCECGQRRVVGMPPTAEDMTAIRAARKRPPELDPDAITEDEAPEQATGGDV